jgi:hypothetical protein
MSRAPRIFLTFRHGLGDAVQFTSVLRHLARHRPEWEIDCAALVGKHSALAGHCRRVLILDRQRPNPADYEQSFDLDWHECTVSYADSPSTKVERCLRETFRLTPDPELFG